MNSETEKVKNIKILHLGKYYPPDRGGIETATQSIVEFLWQKKTRCDVACFTNGSSIVEEREFGKIQRFKSSVKLLGAPFSFAYLVFMIKNLRQYQTVHAHVPNPVLFMILFLLKKSQKLIVHWHSDVINQKISYYLYKPFEWLLLKRADVIIVGTEEYFSRSKPLQNFADKVRFIPYATKAPDQLPTKKEKKDQIEVVCVGRLVPYKGLKYLVEAATHLPADVHIKIVGDGPDRVLLQSMISDLNLKNVSILPSVDDLSPILSSADIFCLPSISRAESFGISLIEAMSFKLPLVTTNVVGSGMNFINKNESTGKVVEPHSSLALASAIIELKNSPLKRQKYSENSFLRFQKVFDYPNVLPKYIPIYKEFDID